MITEISGLFQKSRLQVLLAMVMVKLPIRDDMAISLLSPFGNPFPVIDKQRGNGGGF
jgi:hypothetical protein